VVALPPLNQAASALSRGGEANPTHTEGSAECGHLHQHGADGDRADTASCSPAAMRTGGWAELPGELLAKVLEMLQAVEHQEGGLGFSGLRHGWCALGGRPCTMRW
jgi:hypothetical protein